MNTLTKRKLVLFDIAILFCEAGSFLTWIAGLIEVQIQTQSALVTGTVWFLTRLQRVLFGGVIGRVVDNNVNLLGLFRISIVGYSLVAAIAAIVPLQGNSLAIIALLVTLPIFRQMMTISRVAYVKELLGQEQVIKQVKLLENLPLLAAGLSSCFLLLFSTLAFSTIVSVDLSLHILALSLLLLTNLPQKERKVVRTRLLSWREEWNGASLVLEHPAILRPTLDLYLIVLAFGSYPVLMNIFGGTFGSEGKTVYSVYNLAIAVGALFATLMAHRSFKLSEWPKSTAVILIASGILQIVGVTDFDSVNLTTALLIVFTVGTLVSTQFIALIGEARSKIVIATPSDQIGRVMGTVTRFEFLIAAILALALGKASLWLDLPTTTALLGVFVVLLIARLR